MSLIAIVLVFIMAIVVTVFLSHLLPVKVPLPLIQIAAGAALRWRSPCGRMTLPLRCGHT